jgi:hypothetical protein
MRIIATVLVLTLLAAAPSRAGECVSGTVTAALSQDSGFEGLYKYTVQFEWSLGQFALSHLNVNLSLSSCDCRCDEDLIVFPVPAGSASGPGDDGPFCKLDYFGEYLCNGDPSIPDSTPAVKFEPDQDGGCEPGLSGNGTMCFYSPLAPGAPAVQPALDIKHGQSVCVGPLSGVLPFCQGTCAVAVEDHPWGMVKALFR